MKWNNSQGMSSTRIDVVIEIETETEREGERRYP